MHLQISFNYLENAESCFYIMFEDVPLAKLAEIRPKLLKVFDKLVKEEDINMERIKSIIKRNKLEHLSSVENSPHSTMAFRIIGQLLYGNTKQDVSSLFTIFCSFICPG